MRLLLLIFGTLFIQRNRSQTETVSGCLNDVEEFILVSDASETFEEAIASCEALTPPGQLAVIPNSVKNNFISNFITNVNSAANEFVFFGLNRSSDAVLAGENLEDPALFSFFDGTDFDDPDADFAQTNGDRPWANNRPNNFNGNQDCAFINGNNGLWDDISCVRASSYICQRSCTQTPTRNPTENPSKNPTKSPTKNPTTPQPTQNPTTPQPTENPTRNPTQNPTTLTPTGTPTREPTGIPSKDPTRNPTKEPTPAPTGDPTRDPTRGPTESPTREPTLSPQPIPASTSAPTGSPVVSAESGVDAGLVAGLVSTFCILFVLVGALVVFRDRLPKIVGAPSDPKNEPDTEVAEYKKTFMDSVETEPDSKIPVALVASTPVKSTGAQIKPSTVSLPGKLFFAGAAKKSSFPESSGAKEVDEDVAMLDALVAAGTKPQATKVDSDIETLDALIAAGTRSSPPRKSGRSKISTSSSNPKFKQVSNQNYLKTEKLKPAGRRSIFAPSSQYIEKNTTDNIEDLDI